MANGRFNISKKADVTLTELMVILEIDRPLALKIALSKGLLTDEVYDENNQLKIDKGREIPDNVVWSGFEYTLISHLIIEKEQKVIQNQKDMDMRFQFYIEKGLEIISEELKSLRVTENYLLTLLYGQNVQSNVNHHSSDTKDKEVNTIIELLGLNYI